MAQVDASGFYSCIALGLGGCALSCCVASVTGFKLQVVVTIIFLGMTAILYQTLIRSEEG